MQQSKKRENSKKKQENSESSGTAVTADASAASAASTNLTKPSTTASEIHPKETHPKETHPKETHPKETHPKEIHSKASEFVLPRFNFERHRPYTPEASFSSAELFDELLRDEKTMTLEELDKKYKFYKEGPAKPVPANEAMAILMEEMGSI